MRSIPTLGIASAPGGAFPEQGNGPRRLQQSKAFNDRLAEAGINLCWQQIPHSVPERPPDRAVARVCRHAAGWSRQNIRPGIPFLAVAGDHSSAMGLWKGVISSLPPPLETGLLWLDSHMDLHTFGTSPSANIHGMPLAALLGIQDSRLQRIYGPGPHLKARNLAMIGIHSFEEQELRRLRELNPCIYPRDRLRSARSVANAIKQAIERISIHTCCYGISLDLDVIDAEQAPGVTTPDPGGLDADALCDALSPLRGDPRLVGMEITEYCPDLDRNRRTEQTIARLIRAVYAPPSNANRFFGSFGSGKSSTSSPA